MGKLGDYISSLIAEQLRAERAAARLSQKELAKRSGLSEQSVLRYLNGARDIPMAALAELAAALGVSVQEVVDRALQRAEGDIQSAAQALRDAEQPSISDATVTRMPSNVTGVEQDQNTQPEDMAARPRSLDRGEDDQE